MTDPETLAAILREGANGEASGSWAKMADFLLARGVRVSPERAPANPSEQAVSELARKISLLTIGRPYLSPPASRLRDIADEWLRAAYAIERGGAAVLPPGEGK